MKDFKVPERYSSRLISKLKAQKNLEDKMKKDVSPSLLDFGVVKFYMARHFGFCYGVKNAIEIAFRTISENPDKNIFLLSEMIHNPQVNHDLMQNGVKFLFDNHKNQIVSFDSLTQNDIVLIPAFGTSLEIEELLKGKGIHTEQYNTTCPFVEKVWNRSEQIAKKGYSIIIHGKPGHEETIATYSHVSSFTPTLVISNMEEAKILGGFINKEIEAAKFYSIFSGRYSKGFDITKDLNKIGVVNQTTQLATDTQAISAYLKKCITEYYHLSEETLKEHFADTKDTLCYATNDNQAAVHHLLETPADLALVIGGYNSSNTSHLVELCQKKLTTFFIDSKERIINKNEIIHCDYINKKQYHSYEFIPDKKFVSILVSSGASCPDATVEEIIMKIVSFFPDAIPIEKLLNKLDLS